MLHILTPPDNAVTQSTLGQFEHQVLLSILRRGSESYSVEIVLELEGHTGLEVATAKVFVALKRLKSKGLLADRMVEPGDEGGHARRYFKLTPAALNAMRESRQSYLSLWDGVESQLDESGS
jgi:DNA-binding PadR family transcriptional regulator